MNFDAAEWLTRAKNQARALWAPVAGFFARKDVRAVYDWLKEPVLSVVAVFAFATIVVQPFYVPSGSMQPTLAIGDAVLANKFAYGYSLYSIPYANGAQTTHRFLGRTPKAGDVIVFRVPTHTSVNYVKRLIGLPGDRLQMREGRLWINGRELPLHEAGTGDVEIGPGEENSGQTVNVPRYIETLPNGVEHPIYKWQWSGPLDNTPEFVVPPGHVFMMGDNRDGSADSRVPMEEGGFGYVPMGNLAGKVFVVIGSVDFLNADTIFGWFTEFRFSRVLNGVR